LPERKKKGKGFFDIFDFNEEDFLFGRELESTKGKGGSGYSMSVTYDENGKPVVAVKTYGEVDAAELRRDILQRHPGARIEGLENQPLIKVVGEEKTEKQNSVKKPKEEKKKKKEPLIRVVE
jgi:hypothetical protein